MAMQTPCPVVQALPVITVSSEFLCCSFRHAAWCLLVLCLQLQKVSDTFKQLKMRVPRVLS